MDKDELFKGDKIYILGHRGNSQFFPENTMASFRSCAQNTLIDGVELDVHLCKTGEVVVAHDYSLKRTAGLDEEIEDMELSRLRTIDVGSFKDPRFSEERIPLLDELFSEMGDRFFYDIELKVKPWHVNKQLCTKTLDLIQKHNLVDKVMVSSFNPMALRFFGRLCKKRGVNIPRADIFCESKGVARILGHGQGRLISRSSFLKPIHDQVNRTFLDRHKRYPIISWTINDEDTARRLLSLNDQRLQVRGLIGNDPAMLTYIYKEYKEGLQEKKPKTTI